MIVTIKQCQFCKEYKVFEASSSYVYCDKCRYSPEVVKLENRNRKINKLFKWFK